tara:strand:+ start:691 stop:900 length:210 start_codon:yes stop_codon:yes gene_type:complete
MNIGDIKVGDILLDEIDGEVCVVTSITTRGSHNYQVLVLVSPCLESGSSNRKGKAKISSFHIQENMRLL